MSRGFLELTRVDVAIRKFSEAIDIKPVGVETVNLNEAINRVPVENIISPMDNPPFDRAAMDGFAVKSSDISGASENNPVVLKLVGEASTGKPFSGVLKSGEAVRIDTGARLPEGADAVVMLEYAKVERDKVYIYRGASPYENVAIKGEDVKKGSIVAYAGIPLTPYDLAALASVGLTKIKVFRKPSIAIAAVGSELRELGSVLKEGQIVETNRLMARSILREYPVNLSDYGILSDEATQLKSFFINATKEHDLIITFGGTSVGKGDYTARVLYEIGNVIVHGVALFPSRPVVLAIVNEKPILAFPGYPVAAAISMYIFGEEVIRRLCGIRGYLVRRKVKGVLKRRVPSKLGLKHFARVKVRMVDHNIYVEPVLVSGAGITTSLSLADGFLIVPEEVEGYEAGEVVEVELYRRYII